MTPAAKFPSAAPTAGEPTAMPSITRDGSLAARGNEQGVGRRRIVRTDMKTGKITVLTDRFEGKRYNSPNDVCVDSQGRIWFTDPYYGTDRSALEMDVEGVYRIDP